VPRHRHRDAFAPDFRDLVFPTVEDQLEVGLANANPGGPNGQDTMRITEFPPNALNGFVFDDRNERPLIIALTAIVVVWSLALGLTFASAQVAMRSHLMNSAGAVAAFSDSDSHRPPGVAVGGAAQQDGD